MTLLIIALTVIISLTAFQHAKTFEKMCGWPVRTRQEKDYLRLLTSGFLHGDMGHLFFNMLSLFFFGPAVEEYFKTYIGNYGGTLFLLFYLGSIVVANLPDLYLQKDNYHYRSVGASGGVSAVIFAAVLFHPWLRIGILFIPPIIPGFIFAPLYIALSFYLAKRGRDNIGHIAHITGALFGFLFPILLNPSLALHFIAQLSNGK